MKGLLSQVVQARILEPLLLIAFGYLCGSASFVYLIGRFLGRMDPLAVGSRKLSGSNLYPFLGFWGMAVGGTLDLAKGVLPTWLAAHQGHGPGLVVLVGLAAIVGHNWNVWHRFKGGRGLSVAAGMLLVVFPPGFAVFLAGLALGRIWPHAVGIPTLGACFALPLLAIALGQPPTTVWGCLGLLALVLAKRLEGNREPRPAGETWPAVLWRRLMLDRDVADFQAWTQRGSNDRAA